jgi:serine/threonine-protein kinase
VKVLKQEFSENTNFVSKFRSEAQAAAGLMHTNIVNVYDVGEEEGIYYIVMELVEGITLKNYIEKKSRLSVKEAISIAIQVSMGIEAAHNNHIIHRDIKPQNIMISKDGKVKIADFGIAKAATSNTITSNVMGSVHYTSPEQARGGFSDERSDIYSLGCTMFEMLTGHVPFDGETTVAIAIKHVQEEMPSPREYVNEIPVSVEKIVLKCTQKSPARRYQGMSDLIDDLKKSLISPDEDFVDLGPRETGGETKTLSQAEIRAIREHTTGRIYLDEEEEDLRLNEPEKKEKKETRKGTKQRQKEKEEEEPKRDTKKDSKKDSGKDSKKETSFLKRLIFLGLDDDDDEDEEEEEIEEIEEEEYEDEDEEALDSRVEKITTILAIVAAVIIAVIAIILIGKLMSGFGKQKPITSTTGQIEEQTSDEESDTVEMINVVGMEVSEAKKALNGMGLGVKTKTVSSSYPVNQICEQSVAEGEKVALNTTILLSVSDGSIQEGKVPGVTGMAEADAKAALETAGFKVKVEEEASDSIEKGKVVRQTPGAEETASKGAEVTIYISTGQAQEDENTVAMPDLRGKTESEAKAALESAGLVCGTVSETNSDTVEEGKVVSQSYNPGIAVNKGTTINIVLSAGAKKTTYKYVTTLNAPTGYVSGQVTVTITASDGDKRSFTTTAFPCAVNEANFKVDSGTITYTYDVESEEFGYDEETGTEGSFTTTKTITTQPTAITFTQE